jgi:hypothetical protein
LATNEIVRQGRQLVVAAVGEAEFDGEVLSFDIACFPEPLAEGGDLCCRISTLPHVQESNHGRASLLPPRRQRPRCPAADEGYKIAPTHDQPSSQSTAYHIVK